MAVPALPDCASSLPSAFSSWRHSRQPHSATLKAAELNCRDLDQHRQHTRRLKLWRWLLRELEEGEHHREYMCCWEKTRRKRVMNLIAEPVIQALQPNIYNLEEGNQESPTMTPILRCSIQSPTHKNTNTKCNQSHKSTTVHNLPSSFLSLPFSLSCSSLARAPTHSPYLSFSYAPPLRESVVVN